MWKIRDKPLANEFSHINRDNLNFAANLRKDSHIRLEKEEKPIVVTSKKQEQTTISQTDAAHRILIRVLCNRSDCIKMSGSIEAALDEKEMLIKSIMETRLNLAKLEKEFALVNDESLKVHSKQEMLYKQYEALVHEEGNLHPKLRKMKDERLSLDKEVFRLTTQCEEMEAELEYKSQSRRMPKIYFRTKKASTQRRKHNGIFAMTAEGRRRWSCCLSDDAFHHGCVDDSSVDAKASLGIMLDSKWKNSSVLLDQSSAFRPLSAGAVRASSPTMTTSSHVLGAKIVNRSPVQAWSYTYKASALDQSVVRKNFNPPRSSRSPSPSSGSPILSPTASQQLKCESRVTTRPRSATRQPSSPLLESFQSQSCAALTSPFSKVKLGEIREMSKKSLLVAANRSMTALQEYR